MDDPVIPIGAGGHVDRNHWRTFSQRPVGEFGKRGKEWMYRKGISDRRSFGIVRAQQSVSHTLIAERHETDLKLL